MPEELVLGPGGARRKSLVHKVEPGHIIDGSWGRLRKLDESGRVIEDYGHTPLRARRRPLRAAEAGVSRRVDGTVPDVPGGWMASTSWNNDTGHTITAFTTSWTVPPPPTTQSNQIIFLFNAMGNGMIYQPVLQWGEDIGNGQSWAVASWYADGQDAPATISSLVSVSPGDSLIGSITLTGGGHVWSPDSPVGQTSKNAPALAMFDDLLWAAFVADDSTNNILVCSSADGESWTTNTRIGQTSSAAPSLAAFDGKIWLAFIADNSSNNVLVCSSTDGEHWTNNTQIGQTSGSAASLAVFDGKLWVAFIANNSTNSVLVCSSPDGEHWTNNTQIGQTSRAAPSLAAFNGKLWVAFIANNSTNNVLVCSSPDGEHWTNNTQIGQTSRAAPSLTAWNGLWLGFIADNSTNDVLICSTGDGDTWTGNTMTGLSSAITPAFAALGDEMFALVTATGDGNNLQTSSWPELGFNYNCEFVGIPGTSLPIANVPEMNVCFEALEAYNVTDCSHLPNTVMTAMTAIQIQTAIGNPVVSWQVIQNSTVAPTLIAFGGELQVAWIWNDIPEVDCGQFPIVISHSSTNGEVDLHYRGAGPPSNGIQICSSPDGQTWLPEAQVQIAQTSPVAPALAQFGPWLWLAFIADNTTNDVLVCSSLDGKTWNDNKRVGQASSLSPSMAAFNNALWIAFIADNSTNNVLVSSTSDGITWSPNTRIGQTSSTSPALAALPENLWVAFIADNPGGDILLCSMSESESWSGNFQTGFSSRFAPSLTTLDGRLWLAFISNDGSNTVMVSSSPDGRSWSAATSIGQAASTPPSLTAFNDALWVGFISHGGTPTVLLCYSSDLQNWSNNMTI
jgi:putative hemolysin